MALKMKREQILPRELLSVEDLEERGALPKSVGNVEGHDLLNMK